MTDRPIPAADDSDSSWKQRVQPLATELSRMLELRRKLATLEFTHDYQLLRRNVIGGGIGVVMAMTGLPLLLQAAARQMGSVTSLSVTAWTLLFGTVLLALGTLLLGLAFRKTRSGFCGLQGTLAELNEDLIWLREWAQADENVAATDATGEDGDHS